MKYLVLMYADPVATETLSAAEQAEVFRRHEELAGDLYDSGELLNGAGLYYPEDTMTLRWRENASTTTCGPLADAAEHLAAYYVIDCAGPERARAIAERVLDFHVVAVEVRPIHNAFGMDD